MKQMFMRIVTNFLLRMSKFHKKDVSLQRKRMDYGTISISSDVHSGGYIHRRKCNRWHVHVFYKGKRHQLKMQRI